MTTMSDLVAKTRSMVWGGSQDPLNILAEDYVAGQGSIVLQQPRASVASGSLISVGLNTFYVLAASSDGRTFTVIPGADGGPDANVNTGALVLLRPKATNWSIFRELHDAIADMASPRTGLFWAVAFETAPNHVSGLYSLPQAWWVATNQPQRMIRASYRERGTGAWLPLHSAEWLIERYAVRVVQEPGSAAQYQFTFGFPYLTPSALTDDLVNLGMSEKSTQDIPPLRAAQRLAMSVEGRRVQPFAQGDSRRPEEVPATSSLSVARDFSREYREAVMAERTRLQALFGFQMRIGDES